MQTNTISDHEWVPLDSLSGDTLLQYKDYWLCYKKYIPQTDRFKYGVISKQGRNHSLACFMEGLYNKENIRYTHIRQHQYPNLPSEVLIAMKAQGGNGHEIRKI